MAGKAQRKSRSAGLSRQDRDQATRYEYLLEVLPRTVIRNAHIQAFVELTDAQRQALFDRLNDASTEEHADARRTPDVLLALVSRALDGDAILRADSEGAVAARFIASDAVRSYYTTGVGSVSIEDQPLWIIQLVNLDSPHIDASTTGPRTKSDVRFGRLFG